MAKEGIGFSSCIVRGNGNTWTFGSTSKGAINSMFVILGVLGKTYENQTLWLVSSLFCDLNTHPIKDMDYKPSLIIPEASSRNCSSSG